MNVEVFCFDAVAPVRERGLKLGQHPRDWLRRSRSREGAWIEMSATAPRHEQTQSLP